LIAHAFALMTIIVIAVAMAFAVLGILTGTWSILPGRATESVKILGDSYIDLREKTLYLHIYSNYKPLIVIYRIEVGGVAIRLDNSSIAFRCETGRIVLGSNGISVYAGTRAWIIADIGNYLGSMILTNPTEVKVYTKVGYVYRGFATLK